MEGQFVACFLFLNIMFPSAIKNAAVEKDDTVIREEIFPVLDTDIHRI